MVRSDSENILGAEPTGFGDIELGKQEKICICHTVMSFQPDVSNCRAGISWLCVIC